MALKVRGKGFERLRRAEEVVEELRRRVARTDVVELPLRECAWRVLGVDVVASMDLPPYNRSAVDGYAVKAEDTYGASLQRPVRLKLKGWVKVGEGVEGLKVEKGEAVKVDTGSMLPEGCDAVVMVEYTKEVNGQVEVYQAVPRWRNVSRRGEDVRAGEVVLRAGRLLHPQDLAMAASLGLAKLPVHRRPRVLVAATGYELLEPGEAWRPGGVYNSNAYMLLGLAQLYGAEAVLHPSLKGGVEDVEEVLSRLEGFDAAVLTGGTSAGEEDVVPEALARRGELLAHGLALKPGMPAAAAIVDGRPVFSLPGFPVACMLAFEKLVGPVLAWMAGMEEPPRRAEVRARLTRRVAGTLGRRAFLRVRLVEGPEGGLLAEPLRTGGSGVISSVVEADGYVELPENIDSLGEGEEVLVKLFRGWVA
ncbi:MAG: molybdopterin molybdenumtransferase MoeA [Thermoprotei archaeon]|nr:MAG: molybdopterin molybdenumtransferase MoeA [Thermoprotei archaeon]